MSDREAVDSYLAGTIASWTLVRRLMKAGLSVGTAIAFTALLPAAAHSRDMSSIEALVAQTAERSPDEATVLERLTGDVLEALVKIEDGGKPARLRRTLARLSLNLANLNNSNADLNFNGDVRNVPVNV